MKVSDASFGRSVELTLGGETLQLVFTYGAIAEAKQILLRHGIRCNLLLALDSLDMDALELQGLVYAATRAHHPTLSYERVSAMMDMRNYLAAFQAVCEAYKLSMKSPDGGAVPNPTIPAEG